jgi:hypothetical protein
MAITNADIESLDIPYGQMMYIPCKFIAGESNVSLALINSISQEMQHSQRNILPVVVKVLGEDEYAAVFNSHILAAAKEAKLDFVWCLIVNTQMETQVQIESSLSQDSTSLKDLQKDSKDLKKGLEEVRNELIKLSELIDLKTKSAPSTKSSEKISPSPPFTKKSLEAFFGTLRKTNEFFRTNEKTWASLVTKLNAVAP